MFALESPSRKHSPPPILKPGAEDIRDPTVTSVAKTPSTHSTFHQVQTGAHFVPACNIFCFPSSVRRYQPPPPIKYAFLLPPIDVPRMTFPVREYSLPFTFESPVSSMIVCDTGTPRNMTSAFIFRCLVRF